MENNKPRQPRVGKRAPDFTLIATDGKLFKLSQSPKPLSITFLRHLA